MPVQIKGKPFVNIGGIDQLPPDFTSKMEFSRNGQFLAVAHRGSPFASIYAYDVIAQELTLIHTQTLPGIGYSASWSFNDNLVVFTHANSPFVTVLQRDGSSFTLKNNAIPQLPTSTTWSASFSPDGKFLALGMNTSPHLRVYPVVYDEILDDTTIGNSLSNVPAITTTNWSVSWDSTSTFLLTGTSPIAAIQSLRVIEFVKDENGDWDGTYDVIDVQTGNVQILRAIFSPDDNLIFAGGFFSGFGITALSFDRENKQMTVLGNNTIPADLNSIVNTGRDIHFYNNDTALVTGSPTLSASTKNVALLVRWNGTAFEKIADLELPELTQNSVSQGNAVQFSRDFKSILLGATTEGTTKTNALLMYSGFENDLPIVREKSIAKLLYGEKEIERGFLWKSKNVDPVQQEVFDVLPTSTLQRISYSADGKYFGAGDLNKAITIYERTVNGNNVSYTQLPDPDILPSQPVSGITQAFTSDGTYLAVGYFAPPNFFSFYKRNGNSFIKLPDPDILPTSQVSEMAFTSDDKYLALVQLDPERILIYKREGDTLTKLPAPDILPDNPGFGLAFSSDDRYLAVTTANVPKRLWIYKRQGDTFTKLPDPDVLPVSWMFNAAFSPNNDYLAVCGAHLDEVNSPVLNLFIYKRDGDSFTKLSDPDVLPPAAVCYDASFSPDNKYLTIAVFTSPFIVTYRREGDTFVFDNPDVNQLPSSPAYSVAYSPDGLDLSVGVNDSPFLLNYKVAELKQTLFYGSPVYRLIGDIELEANTTGITFDNLPDITGNPYTELVLVYEIAGSANGELRVYSNSNFNNGAYHSVNVEYNGSNEFVQRLQNPRFSFIDNGETMMGEAIIKQADYFAFMSKMVRGGANPRVYMGNVSSNGGIGPALNLFTITGPIGAGSKFKLYEVIK